MSNFKNFNHITSHYVCNICIDSSSSRFAMTGGDEYILYARGSFAEKAPYPSGSDIGVWVRAGSNLDSDPDSDLDLDLDLYIDLDPGSHPCTPTRSPRVWTSGPYAD